MAEGNTYPIVFAMQVEGDSELQGKMKQSAESVEDLGQSTERTASRTSRFTGALKDSALGLSAATSGAVGLYFSFDNLEKGQTRVDKAQKSLTDAQAGLITAQERLNDLVGKGITAGPDYEKAQLQLKSAQDGLQISTDKLNQAQGDLTESQLNFALQVIPTTISTVSTLSSVIGSLRAAKLTNIIATEGETIANASAAASTVGLTAASAGATIATTELSFAQRALQIAMGPVGWAILGISGFMAIFATNAFGVRDAINAAGKAIGDAVPIMRPLLDTLGTLARTLFPEAAQKADDAAGSFSLSADDMKKHYLTANSEIEIGLGDMMTSFSQATDASGASMNKMASNTDKAADKIVSSVDRIKEAMKKAGVKSVGGAFSTADNSVAEGLADPRHESIGAYSNLISAGLGDPQAYKAALSPTQETQARPLFDVNRSAGDAILSRAALYSKMTFELKIDPATKEVLLQAVDTGKVYSTN